MNDGRGGPAYPVEDFLQALTAQLDRAQDVLALKVRGTGRPLTWALKDINIDLRVFVDVDGQGRITLRSAGPNEDGASTVHLSMTTITRPMVEENTSSIHDDSDPRALNSLRDSGKLAPDDARKLEWMGIRTVGQFHRLVQPSPQTVSTYVGIPVERLRMALAASAQPALSGHELVTRDGEQLVRLHGFNLANGSPPEVHLGGQRAEVVEAAPTHVLVRPATPTASGDLTVKVGTHTLSSFVRLPGPGAAVPS